MAFLDDTGLAHFWSKIKNMMTGKADTDMGNVDASDFFAKALDSSAVGIPVIEATSEDGVAYTATLTGITELTVGLAITIIPKIESASIGPTLDLNGLGAKPIRQKMSYNTSIGVQAEIENWMVAERPLLLIYDGLRWGTVITRPNAADMYGTIKIENGGTGAETAEDARTNLGLNKTKHNVPTMATNWALGRGGWWQVGRTVYVNLSCNKTSGTISNNFGSKEIVCTGLPPSILTDGAPGNGYHVVSQTSGTIAAFNVSENGELTIAVPGASSGNMDYMNYINMSYLTSQPDSQET